MKRKLLIIDDEEQILDLLARIFEGQFEVLTASSGSAGLELIKKERPFFVFLDANLPGMCGLKILGELRELNLPVTVWMLSGEDDSALVKEALLRGAGGYITKPFLMESVVEVVPGATMPRPKRPSQK